MNTNASCKHQSKDGLRQAKEIGQMIGSKRVWANLIAVAILLAVAGCQRSRTIGGDPLAESVRSKIRDVGLARASFEPEIDVMGYATPMEGMAKGGARGAASGFAQSSELIKGAGCSGWTCGPFYVFWVASSSASAVSGFFQGASDGYQNTLTDEQHQILQSKAKSTIYALNTQELIREAVAREMQRRTVFPVEMLDFGPESPDIDARYACNLGCRNKPVVEASIMRMGFKQEAPRFEGEAAPLSLFLTCRVRLVISPIDDTVDFREFTAFSNPLQRSQWEAEQSKQFFEQLKKLNAVLAEKIVNDLFLTYVLPLSL
jgi:hypothetical protein